VSAVSGRAGAQQPPTPPAAGQVAVTVVDHDGKLIPFEVFRAEVHAGCPATGAPVAHLHPARGATALAFDLTEVPDPAPTGCGFGTTEQGTPASVHLRLANIDATVLAAWSARTGLQVATMEAIPAATPTISPRALEPTQAVPEFPLARVGLVLAVLMVTSVIGGYYIRLQSQPVPERPWNSLDFDEPEDGGELRARLARGHADLAALPEEAPAAPPATEHPVAREETDERAKPSEDDASV
jgi:hypothetical protein